MNLFMIALPLMLKACLYNLGISFVAGSIGLCGGAVLGTLNCKEVQKPGLKQLINTYVTIVRGTPVFVQVLICYFVIPEVTGIDMSPLEAGLLALSLNSIAYLAETFRGGINGLCPGQWEACRALGYSLPQSLFTVILPQAWKKVLPNIGNELITLIKESSILMILGVPELTKVSKEIVARELKPLEIYAMTAGLYLAMTYSLGKLTHYLEGGRDGNH